MGENGVKKYAFSLCDIMETTALHYFSPEMLIQVNVKLLAFSYGLPLTEYFIKDTGFIHTSSDGQKIHFSVASLIAIASFKYFGNGRAVTLYSFLDESGQLFYSNTFFK